MKPIKEMTPEEFKYHINFQGELTEKQWYELETYLLYKVKKSCDAGVVACDRKWVDKIKGLMEGYTDNEPNRG